MTNVKNGRTLTEAKRCSVVVADSVVDANSVVETNRHGNGGKLWQKAMFG
jgi:hypothetical protein